MENTKLDLSVLRPALSTAGNTVLQQLLQCIQHGTDEIRKYLEQECDLILECKVCRSLFRGLPNLISHKRIYCKQRHSEVLTSIQNVFGQAGVAPSEAVLVVCDEPSRPDSQVSESEPEVVDERKVTAVGLYEQLATRIAKQRDAPRKVTLIGARSLALAPNVTQQRVATTVRASRLSLADSVSRLRARVQHECATEAAVCEALARPFTSVKAVAAAIASQRPPTPPVVSAQPAQVQPSSPSPAEVRCAEPHRVYPCPACQADLRAGKSAAVKRFTTLWCVIRHMINSHKMSRAEACEQKCEILKASVLQSPPGEPSAKLTRLDCKSDENENAAEKKATPRDKKTKKCRRRPLTLEAWRRARQRRDSLKRVPDVQQADGEAAYSTEHNALQPNVVIELLGSSKSIYASAEQSCASTCLKTEPTVREEASEKDYRCSQCQAAFSRLSALKNHLGRSHRLSYADYVDNTNAISSPSRDADNSAGMLKSKSKSRPKKAVNASLLAAQGDELCDDETVGVSIESDSFSELADSLSSSDDEATGHDSMTPKVTPTPIRRRTLHTSATTAESRLKKPVENTDCRLQDVKVEQNADSAKRARTKADLMAFIKARRQSMPPSLETNRTTSTSSGSSQ